MLDIKFIRENPEEVQEGARKKGIEIDVEKIILLDKERREIIQEIDKIRAKKNRANEEIKKADEAKKKEIIAEMQKVNKQSEGLEEKLKETENKLNKLQEQIPNLPLPEVPEGEGEKENKILREVGERREFSFSPRDYIEIADDLGLIDVKRAAKTSGTRFGFLKKEIALLNFALANLAMEVAQKHNFIPLLPPAMIRPEMLAGMGYLDRAKEEAYFIEKDNLYLAGTSEQVIGPMHAEEVFSKKELPKRYIAYSSCFRREAGSYGKDTKGILRVHQFEKVEMFSFALPQKSKEEHDLLLQVGEELMQLLEIPYQVVLLCTGDMGHPHAKTYDIESWMPGQSAYRETHSMSNCTDFQARRLNIRYKDTQEADFVHTLNGTAFAMGRTIIALLENHQREDGGVDIPQALHKYLPFREIRKGS